MDRDQDQLLLNQRDVTPQKKFFASKRKVKGTGVSITESLTAKRMKQLNKAREEHGFTNVCSADGTIFFKRPSENKSNLFYD